MSSNNINTPPTQAEVDEFINGLSDADKQELKRQRLVQAAVNQKPEKAPDFGSMSDAEFLDWSRKHVR